jgi:hypothetical protein
MTTTHKGIFVPVLALVVALSCMMPSAHAQAISGDLLGNVLDASGAVIPNVTVTATNVATNVKFTGATNSSGDYRIGNLPPGTYDVAAEVKGFTTAILKGVTIDLNRATTANLKMAIGAVSTTVEVAEAGVLLDTTTAQVQQSYEAKQLQDLPSSSTGNGVLNLSLLQAGVASSGGVG